jgi:hypothetical protein
MQNENAYSLQYIKNSKSQQEINKWVGNYRECLYAEWENIARLLQDYY